MYEFGNLRFSLERLTGVGGNGVAELGGISSR
jgi:hypothetical protein